MGCVSGMPIKRLETDCKKPAPLGIYYHYTSLNTLWAILKTETLRATQARFSNDSEEIKKGVHILQSLCSKYPKDRPLGKCAKQLEDRNGEDIDCYIACFCGDSDVLSQWRGYCRSDGVSIGFAFDETCPCYYFKKDNKDCDNNEDGNKDNGSEQISQKIHLYPVWYVTEKGEESKGKKVISEEDLTNELSEKLKELDELSDEQTCKAFIDATIPLIKHAGFCEENEYRLTIRNALSEHSGKVPFPLDKYVCYFEENGTKKPYISISFGRDHLESDVDEVQLYGLKKEAVKELKRLLTPLPSPENASKKCRLKPAYRLKCKGKRTSPPQIVIGPGKNQEDIFNAIDRILIADAGQTSRLFPNVKLWCSGHLPVRSIKVSPCQDQREIIESIRHYCTHEKFWMKYVEVSGSSTPYRRPK